MQRRLLIIALVFVVGFGVGYGITWLLVGSGGRSQEHDLTDSPLVETDTAVARSDARDAPRETDPGVGRDTGGDTLVSADGERDAESADGQRTASDSEAAASAGDASGRAGTDAAQADWDRCHERMCRVDFGRVKGGISIRKGSLVHAQPMEWDRDFARADKIGVLEVDDDVRVEVLAVGLTDGEPAAAYIVEKVGRNAVRGVIALRIGEKVIRLVPVD